MARSVSSTSNDKDGAWIQVLHPSPAPITVRKNDKVGTFQPVEDTDVFITEVSDRSKKAGEPGRVEIIND